MQQVHQAHGENTKDNMVTVLIQCSTLCCLFHLHSVGTESFPSLSVLTTLFGSCPYSLSLWNQGALGVSVALTSDKK